MKSKYVLTVIFDNGNANLSVEASKSREGLDALFRAVEPHKDSAAWSIVEIFDGYQVDVVDAKY